MSVQPTWGRGPSGVPHHSMLASDGARERTVEVLKGAYAEGRLPLDEYEVRVGHAYQSRTYGQLDALVADIPRPVPWAFAPRPPRGTNGKAVGALVCGIGGIVGFGITSIPAVVLGHMARREIRRTGEDGDGLAVAGLVLGYLVIAAGVAVGALMVVAAVLVTSGP